MRRGPNHCKGCGRIGTRRDFCPTCTGRPEKKPLRVGDLNVSRVVLPEYLRECVPAPPKCETLTGLDRPLCQSCAPEMVKHAVFAIDGMPKCARHATGITR